MIVVMAAAVLILDQLSKAWISTNMVSHDIRPIIDGIVRLRYTENTGAAFGLFQGGTGVLSISAIAIIAAIVLSATRMGNRNPMLMLALGLVLGGALGNLTDRLRLGYVRDFIEAYGLRIDLGGTTYTFPVFNVADSAITIGVLLIMAILLFSKPEPEHKLQTAQPARYTVRRDSPWFKGLRSED